MKTPTWLAKSWKFLAGAGAALWAVWMIARYRAPDLDASFRRAKIREAEDAEAAKVKAAGVKHDAAVVKVEAHLEEQLARDPGDVAAERIRRQRARRGET
jgi:hypothetical protein